MKQQGEIKSCLIYLPKDKDKVIIGAIENETKKEYILIEYNTNKFRESKLSEQIIEFIKEWKESEQELRDMFGYKECIYTRNSRSKG